MSRNINVNPDHYKVAGRERQGENVLHGVEKRALAKLRREERQIAPAPRPPKSAVPKGKAQARKGNAPAPRGKTAAPKGKTTKREKRSMATVKAKRHGHTGISNREPPEAEARERREHPPVSASSPPPEDAAGRVGERPLSDRRNRQTSHKAGSRSIAQKEAGARYPDRSMPSTRKVAGAFGREPQRVAAVSADATGAMRRTRRPRAAKTRKKR